MRAPQTQTDKRHRSPPAPARTVGPMLDFFRRLTRRPDVPHGPAFEDAARVAQRPDAPPDERSHAALETYRQAAPYAQQINPADLETVLTRFAKADLPDDLRPTPGVARAMLDLGDVGRQPLSLMRPVGLDFSQLRQVVRRDLIIQSVISTRISQVQRFMRPSAQEWKPGFSVRFKDYSRKVETHDRERFRWLEQYLLNCGAEFDPRERRRLKRPGLRQFTAKHLRDSLSLDAAPVELVPTRDGRTHGFVAVDGARVYLADPNNGLESGEIRPEAAARLGLHIPDPEEVIAVLTQEGRVADWYTHDNLLYPIRNDTTDEQMLGYGDPEPERLLRVVTGILNALDLNMRGISNNSIPNGILNLFGDFNGDDLTRFKSAWNAQATGTSNRFRQMILVSEDKESGAQFIPTGTSVTELMYSRWITLLVTLVGAQYGMDPEEISFDGFKTSGGSMSGSDTEERLASSKDKGLWPLLQWYFETLNEILFTVDPECEVYPTGLDPDQQAAKQEEGLALTYGEYRERRGESAPDDEVMRNAPMNAALLGLYQAQVQAKQQAAPPQPGDPNQPMGPDGQPAPPTGQQQDVDNDGQMEQGLDTDGDGKAEAWQDTDDQGRRRFLDHEGQQWVIPHGDDDDPNADPEDDENQPSQPKQPQQPQQPQQPGQAPRPRAKPPQAPPPDEDGEDEAPRRFSKAVELERRYARDLERRYARDLERRYARDLERRYARDLDLDRWP